MKEAAVRLAQSIRDLRQSVGMTQAELAQRAGVTVETVARLERVLRGRSSANVNPSLETMTRLSQALGVELIELLSASGGPRPREDRVVALLRGASAATRQRVLRVAEALVREELAERSSERSGARRR